MVRILPPFSGRLVRFHRVRLDSAKTYGNLVRGIMCRKTDEFPVPATSALIGPFAGVPEKRLSS